MSIHWPILRRLALHPRKTLIHDDRRSYRGVEILVAAMHLADAIDQRSKKPHVGILLPTSGAFPIAALACWILGRVAVPLNYLLNPDELRFVIDDAELDTVISVGPMLEHLAGPDADPKAAPKWLPGGVSILRMDEINFRGLPDVRWPARPDPDDLGVLLYTSGTSGKPKGVMLTHGNISANIRQCTEFLKVDHTDIVLGVLPQFHSFGITVLTLLPLHLGMRAVYTARFVPAKLLRLMREHRPTIFVAIPSMYNALLHAKDATRDDFFSLRVVVSGGEPLPRPVADAFRERFGVTINEGYGLTETSPVTNACRPGEYRAGSVGPHVPRMIQRIVDIETGAVLPAGNEGEVRMTGPNVMKGYFKRPEETAAAFDEHGFFRTGDIGKIDEDGHLYITGRLKEMLIIGGENVFPREIEEALASHPSVKAAGVVGKPDPIRGELPLAFIELADGEDGQKLPFDEKALRSHCRARIAGYKIPDEIRVVDALPRNPTGKVMRRELKKWAAAT